MVDKSIRDNQHFYLAVNEFSFNIFDLCRNVGRHMQMPFIASSIIKLNNLQERVDYEKFLKFVYKIYHSYNQSVSYHNDMHGSDVAQHVNVMINK